MSKRSGDWGYKVGLEASAVGFAAASLLAAGHEYAMQAVADARAAREQQAYDAALEALARNEAELGAYARWLARELLAERSENRPPAHAGPDASLSRQLEGVLL